MVNIVQLMIMLIFFYYLMWQVCSIGNRNNTQAKSLRAGGPGKILNVYLRTVTVDRFWAFKVKKHNQPFTIDPRVFFRFVDNVFVLLWAVTRLFQQVELLLQAECVRDFSSIIARIRNELSAQKCVCSCIQKIYKLLKYLLCIGSCFTFQSMNSAAATIVYIYTGYNSCRRATSWMSSKCHFPVIFSRCQKRNWC